MNTKEALELLKQKAKTDYLMRHSQATGAIMKALAARFGEDPELWTVAGILHDLDLEETKDNLEQHTLLTKEWLKETDLPEEAIQAICAHNEEYTGCKRVSRFDFALSAAEAVTGLVFASALVLPDKKLASVKPKSVKKRIKEKAFAKNVDRGSILLCEKIDLTVDEFMEISVKAMQDEAHVLEV
ncbi:MAG: HDIG domain-containing protein [Firmicutes bacterium]|nr:HDIG domain-containing protein [Bacillota bacterium]